MALARIVEIVPSSGEPLGQFRRWAQMKHLSEDLAKDANALKAGLVEWVADEGYPDDKGSKWIDFETPIEGYVALQYQRRVSAPMDEEAAERILKARGLYEQCTKAVVTIDQVAIGEALVAGALSADDIDEMFPPKETWAFVPAKDKK